MANPQIMEEVVLSLAQAKDAVTAIQERDTELGFLSEKAKGYLHTYVKISPKDRETLKKGLEGLKLTRLREEHINKIIDFLPTTDDELKVVLQAYPLTLPKKDKQLIIDEVKKVI